MRGASARRAVGVTMCALVAAMSLAACSRIPGVTPAVATVPGVATLPIDPAATAAGTIVSAEAYPDIDAAIAEVAAGAYRIRYRSTDQTTGKPTVVSGAVFVPGGKSPDGGWPIIAFAHGTTGIGPGCGPSQDASLMGGASWISGFLSAGFAVAATDYQGLSPDDRQTAHRYQDAATAGANVVDSVVALRALVPSSSNRWAAFGLSQGGGAAWAAGDLAAARNTGTDLVGVVGIVPSTDASHLVELASKKLLSTYQQIVYLWVLMGLSRTDPNFPISDYWRGETRSHWDALLACSESAEGNRARDAVLAELNPADLVPNSTIAATALRQQLRAMAVPLDQATTAGRAPMYITYAGRDTYIDPAWTRTSIRTACADGAIISSRYEVDSGHQTVNSGPATDWLRARFDGAPAPTTCTVTKE